MAYTAVPSVVTGQAYSASNYNTYVRDNLAAIWVYTTQGDIAVATSATALARLARGLATQRLKMNDAGLTLEYGGDIYRRQGGNATHWDTPGTTNYTPATGIIQTGIARITVASGTPMGVGTATITFPVAFAARPLVFLAIQAVPAATFGNNTSGVHLINTSTASQCVIEVYAQIPTNYDVAWLAIGPK